MCHTCQPSRILREVPGFSLKLSKPPGFTQSTVASGGFRLPGLENATSHTDFLANFDF